MFRRPTPLFAALASLSSIFPPIRGPIAYGAGEHRSHATCRKIRGRKYPRAHLGPNEASMRRHKRVLDAGRA